MRSLKCGFAIKGAMKRLHGSRIIAHVGPELTDKNKGVRGETGFFVFLKNMRCLCKVTEAE